MLHGALVERIRGHYGDLANIAGVTIAFPGESAEYRTARDRLLAQEVELRRAMEGKDSLIV